MSDGFQKCVLGSLNCIAGFLCILTALALTPTSYKEALTLPLLIVWVFCTATTFVYIVLGMIVRR